MGDNAVSSDLNPSGEQGVCPSGWHLPSDAEWQELEIYLGMSEDDATTVGSNRGTNQASMLAGNAELWAAGTLEEDVVFGSTGLDIIPGGWRWHDDGSFTNLTSSAGYWTSTEDPENNSEVYVRILYNTNTYIERGTFDKSFGFSVRCVKDLEE
jgi:uncharacterized protein (TIGR02145 family)